ncbi:MAG: Hpt domain-containing protein [Treponema sp.]|nr:Hpt domain-containing protein [Treponema sp.]
MKVYDRQAALELVDRDEDLLSILVDSFLNENKFERAELEKLIAGGKMAEAASYVHATKGAARQLCMEKLKNSGQALEDLLRGKTSGDIPPLIDQMFSDYEEALSALNEQK